MFEILIVFANNWKGAKHIFIGHTRSSYYLTLRQSDMMKLRKAGLIQQEIQASLARLRIDYPAPAQEYENNSRAENIQHAHRRQDHQV